MNQKEISERIELILGADCSSKLKRCTSCREFKHYEYEFFDVPQLVGGKHYRCISCTSRNDPLEGEYDKIYTDDRRKWQYRMANLKRKYPRS